MTCFFTIYGFAWTQWVKDNIKYEYCVFFIELKPNLSHGIILLINWLIFVTNDSFQNHNAL